MNNNTNEAGKMPKTYAFNDPRNGIFLQNFRDRDGLQVGDTCIWMLSPLIWKTQPRLVGRTTQIPCGNV